MNKKIIYKFKVETEKEVDEESTVERQNKETGEVEKITTTKKVKKQIPYEIIIHEPSRRQVEDADMEFSVEMSKCIKKGILTKAMLAKKYNDTGGLLSEDDSNNLVRLYRELAETQNNLARLNSKKNKNEKEKEKEKQLTDSFASIRKQIVELETTYQSLFNHTADTKAQNKTILWYLLNLSYVKGEEDEEAKPLFPGETPEEKEDFYYQLDDSDDELFNLSKEKLMTFISFWYFSQNASEEDFQDLEKDLDSGELDD